MIRESVKLIRLAPRTTAVIAIIAGLVAGCSSGVSKQEELRLEDTTKSQHAVFLTRLGNIGGPGAADVFVEPHFRGKARVNGRLVLLTHESLQQVEKQLPRPSPQGADYILVEAKLHVEQLSGRVSTDPPSTRSYQGVVLEEILRVQWYFP